MHNSAILVTEDYARENTQAKFKLKPAYIKRTPFSQ